MQAVCVYDGVDTMFELILAIVPLNNNNFQNLKCMWIMTNRILDWTIT